MVGLPVRSYPVALGVRKPGLTLVAGKDCTLAGADLAWAEGMGNTALTGSPEEDAVPELGLGAL